MTSEVGSLRAGFQTAVRSREEPQILCLPCSLQAGVQLVLQDSIGDRRTPGSLHRFPLLVKGTLLCSSFSYRGADTGQDSFVIVFKDLFSNIFVGGGHTLEPLELGYRWL